MPGSGFAFASLLFFFAAATCFVCPILSQRVTTTTIHTQAQFNVSAWFTLPACIALGVPRRLLFGTIIIIIITLPPLVTLSTQTRSHGVQHGGAGRAGLGQ